jgi:ketosteroid isomerase-like protein
VIVSVAGVVVVLAIAIVLIYVFALTGSSSSGSSAEDQIRAVIKSQQDAYNRADAPAFAGTWCKQDTSFTPPGADEMRKNLNDSGQITLTVDSIVVTGDSATVVLEERYSKDTSMNDKRTYKFVIEGGNWKNCGPLNGDTGTPVTPTP